MKKNILLPLFAALLLVFGNPMRSVGQVTIASDGLNNITTLFTLSNGTYYTGNSASGDGPASSPFAVEGTHSRGVSNATATLTSSANINTSGHTGVSLTFRLAAFSIGGTSNGMETGDYVRVEVSPDGGGTYYNTLEVRGHATTANAYWGFAAPGVATTAYDGDGTTVVVAALGGGNRSADGYGTVTVTGLPAVTTLRVRMTMLNNSTNERWVIDDFKIQGTLASGPDAPDALTATATSSSQIDLAVTANAAGDNILIAWNSTNSFGNPTDGFLYEAGDVLPTAGTVLYFGPAATAPNHTGLTAATQYFYKAWSLHGSEYSTGITDNATTFCDAPNAVTDIALTPGSSTVAGVITAPTGGATGYLVVRHTTATLGATPTTGTSYTAGASFGSGTVVYSGTSTSFSDAGLSQTTQYYYFVFSYNSGCPNGPIYAAGYNESTTTLSGPCFAENFSANSFPAGWNRSDPAIAFGSGYADMSVNTGDLTMVAVANPSSMTFDLSRTTNASAKTLDIEVSTTSQTSGFSVLTSYTHGNTTSGGTTACTVDLSTYSSAPVVYIRFNKSVGTNTSPWRIDNINVFCTPATASISLSINPLSGSENTPTTDITLTASSPIAVTGDQVVAIAFSGSANAADLSSVPTSITILNGQTSGAAVFRVVDDLVLEGLESAIFTITGITGGAAIGATDHVDFAINDNDAPVITTGTTTGSPFCVGNTITAAVTVPYTFTGIINAGNTFTAQLSNASGSFTSPTVIGSVASVVNGSISATIPASATAGTGYRIRVTSSNPAANGVDNGSDLIITNFAAPTALASGCGNTNATVSWTNPGCFDEVMLVAKASAFTAAVPSGTSYTAVPSFTGAGTAFDGGKVVYKGTGATETVTDLTNGTTYNFKIFARKGSVWVAGSVVSCAPVATTYANGDYRSIGNGTWLSNSAAPAIWERISGGIWAASNSPSYSTTNNVYIQNGTTITTGGSYGSSINLHIQSGGIFNSNHTGTAGNMYVRTGGTLNINASLSIASGGTLEVEDNGVMVINATYSNPTTSIWNGTENFHPNSQLYIWDWSNTEPPLIDNDVTTNTYSGYTAAFGNLYIDIAGGAVNDPWTLLGGNYGTKNLCHGNIEFDSPNGYDIRFFTTSSTIAVAGIQGDFKMNSGWSSARTVVLATGSANLTLNVKGNFIMDCPGDFSVRASNSGGGGATLNIDGNLLMNGANTTTNTNFKMNQNNYVTANGALAQVNLKGNLTVGANASIINLGAMADQAFNFTGTTTQLVNVGSVVASTGSYGVPFYVKSGAIVQLSTNNLVLDNGSTLTVENGGLFDFNWATNGTTPLLVTQPASPSGTPAFTVNAGGTIKITSIDASGSIATAGNAYGNVRTTNRTYDVAGFYHYIGKANQIAGSGLPTALTTGRLIVDMNTAALTLKLSAHTAITGAGQLGLVRGLLVLDDKNITLGATATVTGTPTASNMVVTNSTGQFFKTYASATTFTYPVGDNVGTVEYSPVSLTFNGSVAGNVGVIVTDGNHPNLPVVSNYLSRYWNFTNTLGTYNYNAAFTYTAADVVGSLASIKAARYSGATTVWNAIAGSNATGTALTITTAQTQATFALNQAFTGLESCVPGTWTGAQDNNWNEPLNWCSGTLPTATTDVIIPDVTNQPIISATPAALCRALTIDASADLTINSGQNLTADGNVTNNGTVYVNNGGNFIQTQNGTAAHAGTGTFVVRRQGNSTTLFNAWSTPVVGGALPGSNGYVYNPEYGTNSNLDDNVLAPDGGWAPHSGAMAAGVGYFSTNGGLATFTGVANNGNYAPTVTGSNQGLSSQTAPSFFNLVGNPYPSAINANLFISQNSTPLDGALYFWDDQDNNFTSSDYATYTTAGGVPATTGGGLPPYGSIASCQGFFVNCRTGNDTPIALNFNNGQRGGDNSQFFRMAAPDHQRMWISINNTNLNLFNQTLVGFDEFATDQKDWGIDAYKFRGNQQISIGAQQDGETYVIATYETIPQSGKVVPLMTYVQTAGTYTFVADSMEGFENHTVYLEDLSNGALYPLTQGDSYSFNMTSADEFGRFQLWFSPMIVTGVDEAANDLRIYTTADNMIVVESTSGESTKGIVQITDMAGRMVLTNDLTISNGIGRLQTANLANGIYAVSFVSLDNSINGSSKVALSH